MQDVTQILGNNQAVQPTASMPSVTDSVIPPGATTSVDAPAEPAAGMSPAFKVITVILLVLIAFVAGLYLGANDIIKFPGSTQTTEEQTIAITTPAAGAEVTGKVTISGTASADLGALQVVLTSTPEGGLLELASATVSLTGEGLANWSTTLVVNNSVTAELATIMVYPADADRTSALTQTVDVSFAVQVAEDRIMLYSPVKDQQLPADTVLLAGQMQDFFEATLNVRLLDEDGTELLSDIITASEDNYGQFADFEKEIDMSAVTPKGKTGEWEFYDVSAADGSETVLLTVPVSF